MPVWASTWLELFPLSETNRWCRAQYTQRLRAMDYSFSPSLYGHHWRGHQCIVCLFLSKETGEYPKKFTPCWWTRTRGREVQCFFLVSKSLSSNGRRENKQKTNHKKKLCSLGLLYNLIWFQMRPIIKTGLSNRTNTIGHYGPKP